MKYNHIEFYEIVYNKKYLNNVNNNRTCNLINKSFVGLVNYFNMFSLSKLETLYLPIQTTINILSRKIRPYTLWN